MTIRKLGLALALVLSGVSVPSCVHPAPTKPPSLPVQIEGRDDEFAATCSRIWREELGRGIDADALRACVMACRLGAVGPEIQAGIHDSDEAKAYRKRLADEQAQQNQHKTIVQFTREQLTDLQGDLMIWAPDVPAPQCPEDPATHIRCVSPENGATPHGLLHGWVWSLTTPRYPKDLRERLYADAKAQGWTHYPINVPRCKIEDGYHALFPVRSCDGYAETLNTVLQELLDREFVTVCAGATPTDPVEPGLNRELCAVVMDDWDNTDQKDCRIDYLGQTFPKSLVYVEMPGWDRPSPDACSPGPRQRIDDTDVGTIPDVGGTWIFNAQKRAPNFVGVLYELNHPDGLDSNVKQAAQLNNYFHAAQQVRFEVGTYWQFWDNLGLSTVTAYNDELGRRLPFLRGFMSGGTAHDRPKAGNGGTTIDPTLADAIDFGAARIHNSPGGIASWAITAHITHVDLSHDIVVDFDRRTGDNRWPNTQGANPEMGVLQYTLGMCLQNPDDHGADCSAVVEFWQDRDLSAGGNASKVNEEWFYDRARWQSLYNRQPQHGEQVGLFVVAGDARGTTDGPIHERSNVIVVTWP
jgi:hypothetical protein